MIGAGQLSKEAGNNPQMAAIKRLQDGASIGLLTDFIIIDISIDIV